METSNYYDLNSLNQYRDQAKGSQRETLKAAVKEFEAYFLNLMLKNMRSANEVLGGEHALTSNDVSFYNEMHDQQLALQLSRSSQFGIGDMLFQQLARALPNDSDSKNDKLDTVNLAKSTSSEVAPSRETLSIRETPSGETPSSNSQDRHSILRSRTNTNINFGPSLINNAGDNKKVNVETSTLEQTNTQNTHSNQLNQHQSSEHSTKKNFIEQVKPYAIEAAKKIGVHPGVLIAQAALETGWGRFFSKTNSGEQSNNLFGIKATGSWQGDSVSAMTIEFNDGIPQQVKQNFRAYDNIGESFNDYVELISENPRYQSAIENKDDPEAYLRNIQNGGYATDPDYAKKIHHIFLRESLNQIVD